MHIEALVLIQPRLHLGVFVRGVVVAEQVQRLVRGCLAVDLLEELERKAHKQHKAYPYQLRGVAVHRPN